VYFGLRNEFWVEGGDDAWSNDECFYNVHVKRVKGMCMCAIVMHDWSRR